MKMRPLFLFSIVLVLLASTLYTMQSCLNKRAARTDQPRPMDEEEEEALQARKRAYIELIHRAAPGTDWRAIEEQNAMNNYFRWHRMAAKTTTSFGRGAFTAAWHE